MPGAPELGLASAEADSCSVREPLAEFSLIRTPPGEVACKDLVNSFPNELLREMPRTNFTGLSAAQILASDHLGDSSRHFAQAAS